MNQHITLDQPKWGREANLQNDSKSSSAVTARSSRLEDRKPMSSDLRTVKESVSGPEAVGGGEIERNPMPLTLHTAAKRSDGPGHLENAACAELQLRAGRAFSDGEWERVRANLLEFVTILREWDCQSKTRELRAVKVVKKEEPAPIRGFGLDKAA